MKKEKKGKEHAEKKKRGKRKGEREKVPLQDRTHDLLCSHVTAIDQLSYHCAAPPDIIACTEISIFMT